MARRGKSSGPPGSAALPPKDLAALDRSAPAPRSDLATPGLPAPESEPENGQGSALPHSINLVDFTFGNTRFRDFTARLTPKEVREDLLRFAVQMERKSHRGVDISTCALRLLEFHVETSKDIPAPLSDAYDVRLQRNVHLEEENGVELYLKLIKKAMALLPENEEARTALKESVMRIVGVEVEEEEKPELELEEEEGRGGSGKRYL
ncbi:hypothetical protein SELMODRAFT_448224 [Selaginella moellendorffii]|uniref:Uncharacterized protein n=1 Tax=Selaginella moellendorffii TaxID=88036 RepID=D8T5Q1_SELML|nr:hypothetical protein SELMODRAFT_448224 [Selaginella moellendorffii]